MKKLTLCICLVLCALSTRGEAFLSLISDFKDTMEQERQRDKVLPLILKDLLPSEERRFYTDNQDCKLVGLDDSAVKYEYIMEETEAARMESVTAKPTGTIKEKSSHFPPYSIA